MRSILNIATETYVISHDKKATFQPQVISKNYPINFEISHTRIEVRSFQTELIKVLPF